ncbi:hypothetical protein PHYPSEUDO_012494 [Phytophthora pseudosyringae]|uniref:Uncharacterized protein n=1 Tax=Phytophthora pseudosyringae TaxID=221518 RepID=A0A8T1WIU0_9STRA|nr:hypothetical protein PHYPSEUDO_012494 [Phytophthora pseudosyringae]
MFKPPVDKPTSTPTKKKPAPVKTKREPVQELVPVQVEPAPVKKETVLMQEQLVGAIGDGIKAGNYYPEHISHAVLNVLLERCTPPRRDVLQRPHFLPQEPDFVDPNMSEDETNTDKVSNKVFLQCHTPQGVYQE